MDKVNLMLDGEKIAELKSYEFKPITIIGNNTMEDIRIKPENIERYTECRRKLNSAESQIKYINRELSDFKGQPVSVTLINGRGYFISQKSEEILNIIREELIRERTDLITEINSL